MSKAKGSLGLSIFMKTKEELEEKLHQAVGAMKGLLEDVLPIERWLDEYAPKGEK